MAATEAQGEAVLVAMAEVKNSGLSLSVELTNWMGWMIRMLAGAGGVTVIGST